MKIFDEEKSLELIKKAVEKSYAKKGENVVKLNHLAAEQGMKKLKKILVPTYWKNLENQKILMC